MKKENAKLFFRHVNTLCYLAGNVTYHEGLQIYNKLHREEARQHRIAENECNGVIQLTDEPTEARDKRTKQRVCALLPNLKTFFLNGDPRGYSLKFEESEVKELREKGFYIDTDWGGYGLLASEF